MLPFALGGHCSVGGVALPPWHFFQWVPRKRGSGTRRPSSEPSLRFEGGTTASSAFRRGAGRRSNSCAILRSGRFAPRARGGGSPSSITVSTWLRSGSRRTLYHEEAATVPTTTRHWDLLIGASSSRLGCHNIDSTRQCLVAHKKCAIHSFAFLLVDVIIPVM